MEKLELKHLAPYLPYGLKVNTIENELFLLDLKNNRAESKFRGHLINIYEWDEIIPILRPLSDLTKEIEVNGEYVYLFDKYQDLGRDLTDILDDERWVWEYPYHIVCDLLEHHFDVFGLIEKGLAIDINTLENSK